MLPYSAQMLAAPSIFGYGVVAKGALKFIPQAIVYDDAASCEYRCKEGARVLPASEFDPEKSTLELVSPGINPRNEMILRAKNLISEADFFAPILGRQIWISGTNGKTTTTAMVAQLLGIKAVGNIGVSMGEAAFSELCAVEMSSFALHYTRASAPEVYVLLDIAPDHLCWHGDFGVYLAAKLSPLERMVPGSLAIVPAWLSGRFRTRARVVYYASELDLARYFGFDLQRIYAHFSGVLALDAALAASVAMAVCARFSDEALASFRPFAHRAQIFYAGDLAFCNDSKATNIAAANECVKSLLRSGFARVHLLLGGDDKGQDLGAWVRTLPQNVLCYGIGARDISSILCARGEYFGDMKRALDAAKACARAGDIIALSPACASFDQYENYAQRGDEFVRLAREKGL